MSKLIAIVIFSILIVGCAKRVEDYSAKIAVSKKIMANREKYAREITQATNECIKSANTLTHLTASGNDQEETIKACSKSAQIAYGAYSPYFEHYLQEWANQ